MIFVVLAAAFFLGATLTGAIFFYFFSYPEVAWIWKIGALLSFLSAAWCGIGLYFLLHKKKPKEIERLKGEFEKFQKECKGAIRGHLKASILFWIHFYRKEKAKSFDDAKKEIFHDLKKEFSDVRWAESMLEHIRQELIRYK